MGRLWNRLMIVPALARRRLGGYASSAVVLSFQRHVGMSPMAYLRDARLRGADAELRAAAAADDTVASIARRWGFAHPGRFAAAYEAKYGQPPGRTLRAAR
jgi:transcriptional regulator GlxA family with amidase domain